MRSSSLLKSIPTLTILITNQIRIPVLIILILPTQIRASTQLTSQIALVSQNNIMKFVAGE